MDQDGHAKFPSKIRASSSTKSFDPDLPSDDILFSLIEIFFAQVQPGCPILHRQTLLDSYFARPVAEQEKEDIILLFAISAAALRFSTDKRLDYEYKNQFKTLAKQKVIFNALENPSIQSLRAMVIIVLDVVGSTNGPSGWGLLALTTRMAIHLGLNTEPSNSPAFLMNGGSKELPSISTWGVGMLPEPRDWIEQEGRRRLFWMVYVLDIYTSLGTSLDLTLDENEIERLLPCQDEIWDRNQPTTTRWFRTPARQFDNTVSNVGSLSSFSFLVEILGLLGRIHRFLRKAIDINNLSDVEAWQLKYRELDKAMMTWKLSLPMQFGNLIRALNVGPSTNSVDPGWVLLHAAYNTAVIRLHSVAAYPTNRSSIFGPSYSAGQRCLSAVQNIAALTRLVLDNNMISQLGSTFAFTLWVSARVLLVHASTTQVPIIPDIRLFLDALHEMGRIYETAERYASILQRVFDELEAAAGDGAFNIFGKVEVDEPSTKTGVENGSGDGATSATTTGADAKRSSCVAILADMRRTAYAVDVLISRQPNSNKLKTVNSTYEIRTSSGFVNNVYNHINYGLQGSNGHAHSTVNNPSLVGQPPFSPNQQQQASNLLGAGISMGTNSHAIEFLDVFNWFNMPRVPMGSQAYFDTGGGLAVNGAGSAGDTQLQGFASLTGTGVTAAGSAENGVTDWLFREG